MIPLSANFQASLEQWTEEDICHFHIHMARQQYERDIKPWADRLVRLKQMEIPKYTAYLPNPEVSGPPSGGSTAPRC